MQRLPSLPRRQRRDVPRRGPPPNAARHPSRVRRSRRRPGVWMPTEASPLATRDSSFRWRWVAQSRAAIAVTAALVSFFVSNGIPILDKYGNFLQPGVIERQRADGFLSDVWFVGAVGPNRNELLKEHSTSAFRDSQLGQQPEFGQYWSKVDSVTDIHAKETAGRNQFIASWTVHYRNGEISRNTALLTLRCSGWRAILPIKDCDRDHILIHDSEDPGGAARLRN